MRLDKQVNVMKSGMPREVLRQGYVIGVECLKFTFFWWGEAQED